ncbi:hypothetical protein OROMI_029219 [Orobanche minor]
MFLRNLPNNKLLPLLVHPVIRSLTSGNNSDTKLDAPITAPAFSKLNFSPAVTSLSTPKVNAHVFPKFNSPPTFTFLATLRPASIPIIYGPAIAAIYSLSTLTLTRSPLLLEKCRADAMNRSSAIALITNSLSPSPLRSYHTNTQSMLLTRSIFNRSSLVTFYTSPIFSIVISPSLLLASRNYAVFRSFPKFKSAAATKPAEALDVGNLNTYFAKVEPITSTKPDGVVLEMKYFACHSNRPDSIKPNLRIHNLRTAYVKDGKLHNLVNEPPPAALNSELSKAETTIKQDLASHKVAEEDLKKIWWDDGGDEMSFWCYSLVKHSCLSKTESIPDFASTTASLGMQVLQEKDLRFFLQKKFAVGKYHKVADLQVALKEYFKADVYPTFIGLANHHPCLYEIGVMHDKTTKKVVDHPMAKYVPQGMFLMRDI